MAVISYYLTKSQYGDFVTVDMSDASGATTYFSYGELFSNMLMWLGPACLFGPVLGIAGHAARRGGFRTLPALLLVPAVAVVESSMRLRTEASLQPPVAAATWTAVEWTAVAVMVCLAAWVATARRVPG
ncbi:DUF6518 family protein [Yinghuangia soli]|uniref:DUF6518 family protein n=1 Tax=Yinghuangia soli TaxID=2908204 RepID=UPI003558C5CD